MTNETNIETREIQRPTDGFSAVILTPYLSEEIRMNPIFEILVKCYDPNNLKGMETLVTPNGKNVNIWAPEYSRSGRARCTIEQELLESRNDIDLLIAGSTSPGEREVSELRKSGIVIGRFSVFFGGSSGYSGVSPGAGGYSLDIPKNVGIVKSLLHSDSVLESIANRDEGRIRSSIDQLNQELSQPILITPFLAEALEVRR
jgi:hypothetical protein